tara:strand:- start:73 stop:1068 length:996 start_codon:yes stop_codon:yes gene_type:complete
MSYSYKANLKGFDSVFENNLSNEIQDNMVEFLDWTLLEKGNYFNVTLGETSPNGSDYSALRISSSQHYSSGQAWEGFRKNWVWQSGVEQPEGMDSPIVGSSVAIPGISGVYVDDTFYPSDTDGAYSHKVDYFNGRIVFDSAIATTSKVQAEHSYKYINVVYASNLPWLREVQYRTLEPNSFFANKNRGDFTLPAEARLQLPAIAVEVVPRRSFSGYQLGGGQYVYTDVVFHCLAENSYTRNQLLDIISLQNEKSFFLFDSDKIADSGAFPLDYAGIPISGALRYPELIATYSNTHREVRMKDMTIQNMDAINSNLYGGIVRVTTEYIRRGI